MNQRILMVLGLVFLIIAIGVVALAVYGSEDGPADEETRSSFNPAISVAAFLPIIIALSQMQRPEYPAQQVFYQLSHGKIDTREKRIAPYLSNRFRSSSQHARLLQIDALAALQTAKSEAGDPTTIAIILRDGAEYICRVVERNKQVDGTGYGKWVVDEMQGSELN